MTMTIFFRKFIWALQLAAFICVSVAITASAEKSPEISEAASAGTPAGQEKGTLSLINLAPELYYTAMRYDKFYGDRNAVQGDFFQRSYLLGDVDGTRNYLIDHGFYLDFGVTQAVQGNVSGGSTKKACSYGSMDGWLWFDSGKAGLWPGGAVFLHGEGSWVSNFNINTGAALPLNFDTTMPDPDAPNWALSEAYFIQALPAHFMVAAGKMYFGAWGDTNMFANNERSQFMYTGLVTNPIAGVFFPYTSLMGWLSWAPNKKHNLTAVYSQTDGTGTSSGFDTLFNGDNTYSVQYIFSTEIANRPGQYLLAGAYSTKDVTSFAVSNLQWVGQIIGVVPVEKKSENYAMICNFAQYLWVKDGSSKAYNRHVKADPGSGLTRHNLPPVGIGVFGRAGWAPENRNAIEQFYSFGIGGYGMLIPWRNNDQWGIGWAGTVISSDLRDRPFISLRSWEQAFEIFYNFLLTPAIHLSLDAQAVSPAVDSYDTIYTLNSRLQIDF